jgi:hypothetical protein
MSIWQIHETEKVLVFVEHAYSDFQAWEIQNLMFNTKPISFNTKVQIPVIGCCMGYENALVWSKYHA